MYTVAVVTGTRADYGLLRPVLFKLARHKDIQLRLLVTGSHLSPLYGNTVSEIEADAAAGVAIDERLDILADKAPEGRAGTAARTAAALRGGLAYFEKIKPDAVLLLGDRYEIFAMAQAAALLDIPVAHISGGDVTRGADDDWFRHCITKMAKLHFPSCEAYRQRLLRMGEQPGFVFNVGGLGDENIRKMKLMSLAQLKESLGLCFTGPFALVTFHPETAAGLPPQEQAGALLRAAEQNPGLFYLFTRANADAGGEEMNRMAEAFCQSHANAALFSSLGVLRYLSAMKHAALVLGNSSSGMVETPSLGTPCVNVGGRQAGRLTSANILHCPATTAAISRAIQKAAAPRFASVAHRAQSPYNGGDTSGKIVRILYRFLQNGKLKPPKIFYDGGAGV
ncbi:MAG: UDP-N-acetylglucosamine 2-epimerase [Oscillospiraceae bacterium]